MLLEGARTAGDWRCWWCLECDEEGFGCGVGGGVVGGYWGAGFGCEGVVEGGWGKRGRMSCVGVCVVVSVMAFQSYDVDVRFYVPFFFFFLLLFLHRLFFFFFFFCTALFFNFVFSDSPFYFTLLFLFLFLFSLLFLSIFEQGHITLVVGLVWFLFG